MVRSYVWRVVQYLINAYKLPYAHAGKVSQLIDGIHERDLEISELKREIRRMERELA